MSGQQGQTSEKCCVLATREGLGGNATAPLNSQMIWAHVPARAPAGLARCWQLTSCADNHGNNEPVDTEHTSHDHRDDRLHHQLWPHHTHGRDTHAGLCRAIGSTETCSPRGGVDQEVGQGGDNLSRARRGQGNPCALTAKHQRRGCAQVTENRCYLQQERGILRHGGGICEASFL